jgi:hypothetical protein
VCGLKVQPEGIPFAPAAPSSSSGTSSGREDNHERSIVQAAGLSRGCLWPVISVGLVCEGESYSRWMNSGVTKVLSLSLFVLKIALSEYVDFQIAMTGGPAYNTEYGYYVPQNIVEHDLWAVRTSFRCPQLKFYSLSDVPKLSSLSRLTPLKVSWKILRLLSCIRRTAIMAFYGLR